MLSENYALNSRLGDAQVQLMRHNFSFNFIDAAPYGANGFSKLAYYNAVAFGNTGGVNNFTIIAVVKPEFTTYPTNPTTLAGYTKATGGQNVYAYPITGLADGVDSYGIARGIRAGASAAVIPNKLLMKNTAQERWSFVALSCAQNTCKLFVDGSVIDNTYTGAQNDGITKLSFPAHVISGASGSNYWDAAAGGVFWPQIRFAMAMFYTRQLTITEIYDLYGMTMYGRGYCINRLSLGGYWLARIDSTVAGDITALPAYAAFDNDRTMIPDLSGAGRHASLFSNKVGWSALMDAGSANSNPGIYVPRVWVDNNNTGLTGKILTVGSSGSVIS